MKIEIDFLVEMISMLSGNTLVLYQLVEKHGEILYDMLKFGLHDKKVSFVHGKVKTDVREVIRETAEKINNFCYCGIIWNVFNWYKYKELA